ncbi:MAG: flagellar filament capping protein FliD [Planctomycetota bacterium]|nr:flagellar filament capping protein FliD [Planctomycetota bacterium]
MSIAPINISGINSGLDTNSIISQLMAIERQGLNRLNTQKATLLSRQDAYRSFDSKLSSLRTAAKKLNTLGSLISYKGEASDKTKFDVAASTSAVEGNYHVTILNRSTKSVLNGTSDVGLSVDATKALNDGASLGPTFAAGAFTINSTQITVAATDTLDDVVNKINTSGAGVTASYDSMTDKFTLSSGANISLGSGADTSNTLSLLHLQADGTSNSITSSSALGGLNVSATMNDGSNGLRARTAVTDGGSGAGQFFVNGVAIDYNASTDSLSAVLTRINNSAAGVTATYDKSLDRVVLTNKSGGTSGISATDAGGSGNFVAALGLGGSATLGSNARITVDGFNNNQPITSADDVFTEAETGVPGLTLTLKSDSGSADVSVTTDNQAVVDKMQSFVNAYNDLMKFITDKTKVTGTGKDAVQGPLYGQQDVRSIRQTLREVVGGSVAGIASGVTTLAGIGVGTTGSEATLSFDSAKFSEALENAPGNFKSILADAANGVMTRVVGFVDAQTNFGSGPIAEKPNNMEPSLKRINASITRFNRNLDLKEQHLKNQFNAMERALSNLNTAGVSAALSALNSTLL